MPDLKPFLYRLFPSDIKNAERIAESVANAILEHSTLTGGNIIKMSAMVNHIRMTGALLGDSTDHGRLVVALGQILTNEYGLTTVTGATRLLSIADWLEWKDYVMAQEDTNAVSYSVIFKPVSGVGLAWEQIFRSEAQMWDYIRNTAPKMKQPQKPIRIKEITTRVVDLPLPDPEPKG